MATINSLNNASAPFTVSSGNLVATTGDISTSAGSITSATGFTATTGGLTISAASGSIVFTGGRTGPILSVNGERYLSCANHDSSVYLGWKSGPATNWNNAYNIIVGAEAGNNLTNSGGGLNGSYNTIVGQQGLLSATSANFNVILGDLSLYSLTSGYFNTVLSNYAAYRLLTGNYNLILGTTNGNISGTRYWGAGYGYTSSESNNICIQATGTAAESNVLRIGDGTGTGVAQIATAYISGIYQKTAGASAEFVTIGSDNKLGTTTSLPGSFIWNADATTTISAAAGNGYILTNGTSSTVTVTLPASPTIGDRISVVRMLAGITNIAQGSAGQIIYISSTPTTSGTGHGVTAASATSFRKMELLCYTTNKWVAIDMAGSWTTY